MNATRIVADALKIESESERDDFVKKHCQNNPEMLQQITQMLALEMRLKKKELQPISITDPPEKLVDTGILGNTRLEQPGATIGPYSLHEIIGEGGMGSVWRAEQRSPVRRDVALKVIKIGMDTREVIARFEAERQALAMMNHPNIAKVLDVGATGSGRPFFVMELVDGKSITDHCDQQRLTTRERLELFTSVCDAIQHAHMKGVIHRDIKPSNVLIAATENNPIVKVIDFGLAKATGLKLTEKTLFTAFGQVMGTPAYMSPEQTGLPSQDVDTRTDVYSLGVLLYELLVGFTPFDFKEISKDGYSEILRTIREDDPPLMSVQLSSSNRLSGELAPNRNANPSTLINMLRGDLEIIVGKALEKDRDRRYQTPRALADDIERYLKSEAIEARPASMSYRLKKTVQRNKTAFIALSVIAASLVIGIGVSTWQAIRATNAEQDSAARLVQTRQALDAMSSFIIDDLLAKQSDVTPSMRKLLDESLTMYKQLAIQTGNDRETRASVAAANYRVASIQNRLGIEDLGLRQFETAADLYAELVVDFPTDLTFAARLVESYRKTGLALVEIDDFERAEEQLKLANKANDKLRQRFGEVTKYFEKSTAIQYSLSFIYRKEERDQEAETMLRRVIAGQKELINYYSETDQPTYDARGFLASATQQLGLSLRHQGKNKQARETYRSGIKILRDLQNEAPLKSEEQYRLGVLLNDIGVAYKKDGDFEQAEQYYRQSLEVRSQAAEQFPNDLGHIATYGGSHLNMGNLFRLQDKPEESLPFYQGAIDALERVRSRNPKYYWGNGLLQASYRCRTDSLIRLGRYEQAINDLDNLDEVYIERDPENHKTLPVWNRLRRAYVLVQLGEEKQALKIVDSVLAEVQELGDEYDLGEASYFSAAVYAAMARNESEPYGKMAVNSLKTAVEHDFTNCNVKELDFKSDPDFEHIREREDFKQLQSR